MTTFQVFIYALIDPRTNLPFYVGATKQPLSSRLNNHVSDSRCMGGGKVYMSRSNFITEILASKSSPQIKLLRETTSEFADHYECFYYRKFIKKGLTLLQSGDKFNYSKVVTPSALIKRSKGYVYEVLSGIDYSIY